MGLDRPAAAYVGSTTRRKTAGKVLAYNRSVSSPASPHAMLALANLDHGMTTATTMTITTTVTISTRLTLPSGDHLEQCRSTRTACASRLGRR
jgi:hypothetical protein